MKKLTADCGESRHPPRLVVARHDEQALTGRQCTHRLRFEQAPRVAIEATAGRSRSEPIDDDVIDWHIASGKVANGVLGFRDRHRFGEGDP